MTPRELMQRRASLVEEVRQLIAKAEEENRDFNTEEQSAYDAKSTEIEGLNKRLERQDRSDQFEALISGNQDPNEAKIGMSQRDLSEYSFVRAIRAATEAARGNQRAWDEAGLELAASRAVAEKLGKEPNSFFVPFDVIDEKRDLTVGTSGSPGGGYYTVADELKPESFISMLRNKMVVKGAGAQMLTGLVGDILIPRQTGGATAYWLAESGAPTESAQTTDQVSLTPHTVGAFTDLSRKLIKQSSIDVENFVRGDLALALALAIDLASLHGTGADNQPTGIAATTGIGSVAGGTNGLAPAWSHIINLETEVAQDNADLGSLAYITNAKVRGKLKQTYKNATYGEIPIWEKGRGAGVGEMNGYPAWVTNQVSSALTKGTSSGVCSAIFYGNWRDLLIGMWGALDVLVDPYTGSSSGTVRVVTLQDVDVAVRHAQSFAAMLDALTA